jgi:hypothetical protein
LSGFGLHGSAAKAPSRRKPCPVVGLPDANSAGRKLDIGKLAVLDLALNRANGSLSFGCYFLEGQNRHVNISCDIEHEQMTLETEVQTFSREWKTLCAE